MLILLFKAEPEQDQTSTQDVLARVRNIARICHAYAYYLKSLESPLVSPVALESGTYLTISTDPEV